MKKRVGFVLLAALAVMVTMLAGCGTPNVVVKVGNTQAMAMALQAQLSGYWDLTFKNVHVHNVTTGENVIITPSVKVDMVGLLNGTETTLCSGRLPAGTYKDFAITFWSSESACSLDIVDDSANPPTVINTLFSSSSSFNFMKDATTQGIEVTIPVDSIVVTADGQVTLNWDYNVGGSIGNGTVTNTGSVTVSL